MRLVGNINHIKQQRENQNQGIELHLDKVEYITYKKDGKYYQPFDYVDELETPLVVTGDCLSRTNDTHLEEGEYKFNVYQKTGEDYILNPDISFAVTTAYDFDADTTILTSTAYVVTISNEAYRELKTDRAKARRQKKGRGRKSNP